TFVGVGNADSDVRPTLAAVVAESTASVAAWILAAPDAAVPVEPVPDALVPAAACVGVVRWAGGAAVVARWCSARTAPAAAAAMRNRTAKTTIALKTKLRFGFSSASSRVLAVRGSGKDSGGSSTSQGSAGAIPQFGLSSGNGSDLGSTTPIAPMVAPVSANCAATGCVVGVGS